MEFYVGFFPALVIFNIALYLHRRHRGSTNQADVSLGLPAGDKQIAALKFKWEYFAPYALVVAADWLQVISLMSYPLSTF